MFWKLCILLLCIFAERSFQNNISCSTKCTLDDVNLDCWESTENYAVKQIIDTLNNLTELEIMIDRWQDKHGQPKVDVNKTVSDIMDRINGLGMNGGPLDSPTLNTIMQVALYQIVNWTAARDFAPEEHNYDYYCPVSCDYYHTMWMYLFICVTVILILTLMYIAIYLHRLRSQIKKRRLL